MKNFLYFIFITFLPFLYTACSLKPQTTIVTTYALNKDKNVTVDKQNKFCEDRSLRVASIKGRIGINNINIYYSKADNELQPYTKSFWSEPPSIGLKRIIYLDLISSNIFSSVSQEGFFLRDGYLLQSDIYKFEQKFDEELNSTVEIGAIFYLADPKNSKVISSKEFFIVDTPPSNDAKGAVHSFNRIANELSKDVTLWLKMGVCKN